MESIPLSTSEANPPRSTASTVAKTDPTASTLSVPVTGGPSNRSGLIPRSQLRPARAIVTSATNIRNLVVMSFSSYSSSDQSHSKRDSTADDRHFPEIDVGIQVKYAELQGAPPGAPKFVFPVDIEIHGRRGCRAGVRVVDRQRRALILQSAVERRHRK